MRTYATSDSDFLSWARRGNGYNNGLHIGADLVRCILELEETLRTSDTKRKVNVDAWRRVKSWGIKGKG